MASEADADSGEVGETEAVVETTTFPTEDEVSVLSAVDS